MSFENIINEFKPECKPEFKPESKPESNTNEVENKKIRNEKPKKTVAIKKKSENKDVKDVKDIKDVKDVYYK